VEVALALRRYMLTGPRFLFVRAIDRPFQLGLFAGFPSSFDLHLTRASHRPLSEYSWLPKTGALLLTQIGSAIVAGFVEADTADRRTRTGPQRTSLAAGQSILAVWFGASSSCFWCGQPDTSISLYGLSGSRRQISSKGNASCAGDRWRIRSRFFFHIPVAQLVVPLPLVHGYRAQAI
jgi:hypothetical protein